jgi:hypothetical protein
VAQFYDFVVIDGPDKGMRYSIEAGTYRVIGRASDDNESTVALTTTGDRMLDADQQALIDNMAKRAGERAVRTRFKKRGSDMLVHDDSVSRTHAALFADEAGVSVADLMSTNGTRVNGTPTSDVDLGFGDVVHVGKSKFQLKEG